MNKPVFFISSTVYDFKDLRSALKYHLEQHGCRVLCSEFPDFRVDLDKDSYQACIDAIATADYFVLFVGGRVGGWYDKQNRISITQKEYREAYRLHKLGRLKIISFVRSEIWEMRENRRELKRFVASADLSESQKEQIGTHPSKQCDDPEFVIAFLTEVTRNAEMKVALDEGNAKFPSGNWIYNFTSFREIIDAIEVQIFADSPLEETSVKHLLEVELRHNLKALLWRGEDFVTGPAACMQHFYAEHPIPENFLSVSAFTVKGDRWRMLSVWCIHLIGIKLSDRIIEHCQMTSVFLEYDQQTGRVRGTPGLALLRQLSEEIRMFRMANTNDTVAVVFQFTKRQGYTEDKPVPVPPAKLLPILHVFDRWINIIRITESLLRILRQGEYIKPALRPKSPIPDMDRELEGERVTEEELDRYLSDRSVVAPRSN